MYACKEKDMLFVYFITHYLPCVKKKILEPLGIDGIYLFKKKHLNTQINNIFEYLKDLKANENVSFFEFLNYLNMDENKIIYLLKRNIKNHAFKKNELP